jgi:peroxiredoxin
MPALAEGKIAPDFSLPVLSGGNFSLREALAHGPVVLAFFKVSCPVCQFAFPYLQRIYQAHGGENVTIVGVSQNNSKDTAAFAKQFGVTFTMLLDDTEQYPVSNAYGLTNVPTIFWIDQDATIAISCVGWSRKEIEAINRGAAEANAQGIAPVFLPDESIPEFRAG